MPRDLTCPVENLTLDQVAERCDLVFCCLPHGASAESVRGLLASGKRIVDLSADYRLDSAAVYQRWYGAEHPDPSRLGATPYGLPEWFADQISDASLVANPGCYPTSSILPLAPLLREGMIDVEDIIIDSKSGVSGAGRTPKLHTHFPECNESLSAYGVGQHRHAPEIERILGIAADRKVSTIFTPHLVPMDRGIFTTTYSRPLGAFEESDVLEALRAYYAKHPFVRVVDRLPSTKHTIYSNFVDITARIVRGRILTLSCLDNLIKGASGAAVQNMNVMYGWDETTALL